MRDYGQIITKIQDSPWLITEGGLRMILQIVESHVSGKVTLEEIKARTDGGKRNRGSLPRQEGSVGLLPVHGPIFPRANLMTELSGATSIEQLQQDFRGMMANDRVSSILLDIDSPGGSSAMINEMADEIRAATKFKNVYAVANTMAGSAAYWLMSQATEAYVTDSGHVGSVGAYTVHTDASELAERAGVKETVFKEGRFKAAFLLPLTSDSSEHIQNLVTEAADSFIEGVALGRKTTVEDVRANYGEGGVVSAKTALETGMVDGIRTFDEVLGALLDGGGTLVTAGDGNGSKGGGLSFAVTRSSFDKEKEHADPGTGAGEPLPRPDPPNEKKDDWRKSGGRFDTPPGISEASMNREQLLELATKLGIEKPEQYTDDAELLAKVNEAADNLTEVAGEISAAAEGASVELEFAKKYPEQAEELRVLKNKNAESDAKLYAESFLRIKDSDGNDMKHGLGILARQLIAETHLKMKQNNLMEDDLTKLIHTVGRSVVKYEEEGSSRQVELPGDVVPATRLEARNLFTERVKELMKEDGMDRRAAIAEAGKRWPNLAQAYATS